MTTQTTTASSKHPTHAAYVVRDREGKKAVWTRIGSAWSHTDGNGFNLQLEATPIDGRLTLRVITDAKE